MAMGRFPGKIWDVSHKIVAVEAGLGLMGMNRLVLHPKYGSCIQLVHGLVHGVLPGQLLEGTHKAHTPAPISIRNHGSAISIVPLFS